MIDFRPVVGFPGYLVTSDGKVWSSAGRRRRSGRWLHFVVMPNVPYLRVALYRRGQQHKFLVHRLVLEAFVGPCPEGMEACHNNGDPADNRLENLRWDTHSRNTVDCLQHGTHNWVNMRGETHHAAKITDQVARRILAAYSTGSMKQTAIARQLGVSKHVVWQVVNHRTWRHICPAS
jgi:hypothetical protein